MHSSKSIPEMPGNASVSDAAVRGLRFVRPPIGMPDVRGWGRGWRDAPERVV